jgi:hypothetical protein
MAHCTNAILSEEKLLQKFMLMHCQKLELKGIQNNQSDSTRKQINGEAFKRLLGN